MKKSTCVCVIILDVALRRHLATTKHTHRCRTSLTTTTPRALVCVCVCAKLASRRRARLILKYFFQKCVGAHTHSRVLLHPPPYIYRVGTLLGNNKYIGVRAYAGGGKRKHFGCARTLTAICELCKRINNDCLAFVGRSPLNCIYGRKRQ